MIKKNREANILGIRSEFLSCLAMMFLASCAVGGSGTINAFERMLDYDIGKPINASPALAFPHSKIKLKGEKTEYAFKNSQTGCEFAYIVDDKTTTILQWRYLSEPELCYVYSSWWQPW